MPCNGIVVLDEDPVIENFLNRLLERSGYRVVKARPVAAIQMVRSAEVALIITNAPRNLLGVAQNVAVLYLSSSPDAALAALFPRCRMVVKPFTAEILMAAVHQLVGTP